jgi:hypothetical protein
MGLFDSLFSGKSGRLAAMQTAQQLANTQGQITNLLNTGQNQAIGAIQGAQPLALSALGTGYDTAMSGLKTGYDTAMPALQTGYNTARADYGRASDLYNPYATTGAQGFNMLANATGLNGPEGNQAAVGAFQAGPGYKWQTDQALEGILRKQGAMGMAMGGNTLAALGDRAGQLANQEYNNWRNQLQGIANTGYNATTAQAGLARGQGDLATGYGQNVANMGYGYGQDVGKMAYGYGANVGDIYRGDAAKTAGVYGNTTALGVNALSDLGRENARVVAGGMNAGQQAAGNQFNALMSLLGLGTKAVGAFR